MGTQTSVGAVVGSAANRFHGGGVRPLPHAAAAAIDGGQGSCSATTGGGVPVVVLVLMVMLPPLLLVLVLLMMMVLVGKIILIGRVEGGVVTLGLLEQDAAALVGRNAVQIIVLLLVVKVIQRWPMTPCPRPAGTAAAHVGGTAARDRTYVGLMRRHRRQRTWRHVRDGPGRPNSGRHLPIAAMVGCCILPTDASRVGGEERRRYRRRLGC